MCGPSLIFLSLSLTLRHTCQIQLYAGVQPISLEFKAEEKRVLVRGKALSDWVDGMGTGTTD